jgi:two-component system chemotaxis sensor kinase CheA
VIKPLGKQFESLPGIAGSAILGNGRVALILDVAGLVRAVMRSHRGVLEPSRDLPALVQGFGGPSVTECR